jgi:hypothetical protein
MRKSKTVKIDDKEITVKEMRVKDIRSLLNSAENEKDVFSAIEDILPRVTDLPTKDFEELAPSEMKQLWEAFKEVNADFFDLLEKTGFVEALKQLISKHLTEGFASLSNAATEMSGNTDTASS